MNKQNIFDVSAKQDFLTLDKTAEMLGVSTATVQNWIKAGTLPLHSPNTPYILNKTNVAELKLKLINGQLKKLNKRANKTQSLKTFMPEEYIKDKKDYEILNKIILFIHKYDIDISTALFCLSLNLLKKQKILVTTHLQNIIQDKHTYFSNPQIKKEINSWLAEIKPTGYLKNLSFLFDCVLPESKDCLGVLYQSLLFEGKKSKNGSYYTPANIVYDISQDYVKKASKVLDPCCGTGQFLLAFSDVIQNPLSIYGIDRDPIAVKIARLNILVHFKNKNFIPNIFLKDTLFDIENYSLFNSKHNKTVNNFDVIATNPPWGACFSKEEKRTLSNIYPEIRSFESFSYFIKKSLSCLSNQGVASFILPESILNVKAHKDIREIILRKTEVIKIVKLGKVFKNVFTPVIRLDLKKNNVEKNQVLIQNKKQKYKIEQIRWSCNLDFVFDININPFDQAIIEKIYKIDHTTLKNKSDWALGIVTGDNTKFLVKNKRQGYEPIYTGKNVQKLILSKPSFYIDFQPNKFQQIADRDKYRAPEKLIYRFISKKLIFAYDNQKRLTLNSANIVIPKLKNYPIKVILSLFNSSVYQFIFQKKFFSIKVLRSHIEAMPLPLWDQNIFSIIVKMVDELLQGQGCFQQLDNYIMDRFALSEKEKQYIKNL